MTEAELLERLVRVETRFSDTMENIIKPMSKKVDEIHSSLHHNGINSRLNELEKRQKTMTDDIESIKTTSSLRFSKWPVVEIINKIPMKLLLAIIGIILASIFGVDVSDKLTGK
jgi:hypothetical protein